MNIAFPVIFIAIAAGVFWLTQVYLPRQRRLKRAQYLEIIGDEGTHDIETGTHQRQRSRRSSGSGNESTRYHYARLRLEPPWSTLSCALSMDAVPQHESPLVHESPTETQMLCCWGHPPEAAERLQEAMVTSAIRSFLGSGKSHTIVGGVVTIEHLAAEVDPMAEVAMMTDISDLRRVLG